MRPKKVILCAIGNEQELSVVKFLLDTNGYRVLPAATGQEALEAFTSCAQIDLVMADQTLPQTSGNQLARRFKELASYVPVLLLGDPQGLNGELLAADVLLSKKNATPHELLDRVKTMSARKRGPRKGMHRAQPLHQLAVAS